MRITDVIGDGDVCIRQFCRWNFWASKSYKKFLDNVLGFDIFSDCCYRLWPIPSPLTGIASTEHTDRNLAQPFVKFGHFAGEFLLVGTGANGPGNLVGVQVIDQPGGARQLLPNFKIMLIIKKII